MGTDLSVHDPRLAAPPVPIDLGLDRAVRFLTNRLVVAGLGHEIAAADAPSPNQREAMQDRTGLLAQWLAPAGAVALIDEVSKVLLMPAKGGSVADAKALIKLYASDLADLPLFAVVRACADFRQGRVGEGWRPSQAMIRKQAERYAAEVHREKRRIEAILTARITQSRPSAEHRRAVAEQARAAMREAAG